MNPESSWRTTGLPRSRPGLGRPRIRETTWLVVVIACGILALASVLIPVSEGSLFAVLLVLVSAAVATVYFERGQERRWSRLALASAVVNAVGLVLGAEVFQEVAQFGAWPYPDLVDSIVPTILATFGLSSALGLLAVPFLILRRGRLRGWIFAGWGIYVSAWFGWLAWWGFVEPFTEELTLEEERLAVMPGAAFADRRWWDLVEYEIRLPANGSFVVDDEVVLGNGETSDEALRGILRGFADRMKTETLPSADGEIVIHPEPLHVWCDADTPCESLLHLFEICAEEEIRIGHFRLPVRRDGAPWLGILVWNQEPGYYHGRDEPRSTWPMVSRVGSPDASTARWVYSQGELTTEDLEEWIDALGLDAFGLRVDPRLSWQQLVEIAGRVEGCPTGDWYARGANYSPFRVGIVRAADP